MKRIFFLIFAISFFSCKKEEKYLFELQDNTTIGIDFVNQVDNTKDFNIFNYRNFYNGGGVAIGDINNDGLPDIYFTANQTANKLYLNKGNFQFEDITEAAGVDLKTNWSTGVVMADINSDGLLDIYVCNAGYQKGIGQENTLFINNGLSNTTGQITFTDKAADYGLNESGYSTHAAFFDYDRDGDLDAYILNNSFIPVNTLNNANNRELRAKDWPVKDFLKGGGDKLLRNDGSLDPNGTFIPKYIDVSEEAGIYGSLIGFGLGVTVGDLNNDSYPDIYVSNDFYEKDYLYINQRNGTFKEEIENRIGHTSFASMGADMADINNDGSPELFVTDMLPRDETRLKTTTAFDSHYSYELRLKRGFYHQYMQNTLQLNNGSGEFSEIANYAGVESSDWSWGALLFDADNDRKNDIFVCNGIQHDVIDQDFIDFFANELSQNMAQSGKKDGVQTILEKIPSKPLPNIFFKNIGHLKFEEQKNTWIGTKPSFSNGAAYADLDNDGDLDLVVNNVNSQAFVYKNQTDSSKNFIKFNLKYKDENPFAIGSQIDIYKENEVLSKQLNPSRGFQSSTEYNLTFGLGDWVTIDSVIVTWPNGYIQNVLNPQINKTNNFLYSESELLKRSPSENDKDAPTLFTEVDFDFLPHEENKYEDYYFEKNIPFKLSNEGPKIAIGDLNGDSLDDIFICGAKNQASQIYFQSQSGFKQISQNILQTFAPFEDTAVCIFDADQDGDQDIYIGAGGNEGDVNSREYLDRLYLNDGKGNFSYAIKSIPPNLLNTSTIEPYDFDKDGDLDLFVGSRSVPKEYGISPASFIYENTGSGTFKDVTKTIAPFLLKLGMVKSAKWIDINNNGNKELVVVGDWMSPQVIEFNDGKFQIKKSNLENLHGFWGAVESFDIDNDGDEDLILGNIGENFALDLTKQNPMTLYINDFDGNGTKDKLFSKVVNGNEVPIFLKREMMDQFPALKSTSLKHSDYATKTIRDLFDETTLSNAEKHHVNYLKSIIAINDGQGNFSISELPFDVQYSCIQAISTIDFNKDGFEDILLAGNAKNMIPQFNTLDACRGICLKNNGDGTFSTTNHTGFEMKGQAKSLKKIKHNASHFIIGSENNQSPKAFRLNE